MADDDDDDDDVVIHRSRGACDEIKNRDEKRRRPNIS
jgi:hypothetical protein